MVAKSNFVGDEWGTVQTHNLQNCLCEANCCDAAIFARKWHLVRGWTVADIYQITH